MQLSDADLSATPYRVLNELGRGGMGVVYIVEHKHLKKLMAMKVLDAGIERIPGARERFLLEGRATSSLDHPNIVAVTDLGELANGQLFIVVELLRGKPFDRELTARAFFRPIPPELDAIVLSALAKDPGARFQSAREFADALAPFAAAGSRVASGERPSAAARAVTPSAIERPPPSAAQPARPPAPLPPLPQPSAEDWVCQTGQRYGSGYLIREPIGRGGMSQVFLAEKDTMDRRVAFKVLNLRYRNREDIVRRAGWCCEGVSRASSGCGRRTEMMT